MSLAVAAVVVAGIGVATNDTGSGRPSRTTVTLAASAPASPAGSAGTSAASRTVPSGVAGGRSRAPIAARGWGAATGVVAAPADRAQRSGRLASGALATLTVRSRDTSGGYDRARFGSSWTDDNRSPLGRNGCDTRNDVLRRDLSAVVVRPGTSGCVAWSGVLHDPYTGRTIAFRRDAPGGTSDVQVDHVVALSDAWQTGARTWTDRTRTDFANDPLNLLVVDGPTNAAKGDGDAATWLPPNTAYRCAYVARQIAVKQRYSLWMTPAERAASARVVTGCDGLRVPGEARPAVVERVAPRTPTPPTPRTVSPPPVLPAADCTPGYDPCVPVASDVDCAGGGGNGPAYVEGPITVTGADPYGLDADGDGIGCDR